jgi:hypothetical protein
MATAPRNPNDPLNPVPPLGTDPLGTDSRVDNRTVVQSRSSGNGVLIAAVVLVLAIIAYFVFAPGSDTTVNEPAGTTAPATTEPAPADPATPPAGTTTPPADTTTPPATDGATTPPADTTTPPADTTTPPATDGTTTPPAGGTTPPAQ